MKKIVWIVGGLLIAVLIAVWIGRASTLRTREVSATEAAKYADDKAGGLLASTTESNESVVMPSDGSGKQSARSMSSVEQPDVELSASVTALLLQDGKEHTYATLLQAIAQLDYNLPGTEVSALMEMLAWPNDRFPQKMRPIEINAVKNDVLDKLMRQTTLPDGLGLQIAEMAANPANDPVWREYCVQFMGPFYDRRAQVERSKVEGLNADGELLATKNAKTHENENSVNSVSSSETGGENNSSAQNGPVQKNESDVIREALFAALDERGTEMAGTALIGLENLSRTHAEFDRDVIALKAVSIASDETALTESRMTALRLAAQVGMEQGAGGQESGASDSKLQTSNPELIETARELAQTGETVLMRSAAIVTLGEVGSASDRELLESYAVADNKQIAAAARMALAKMDARDF